MKRTKKAGTVLLILAAAIALTVLCLFVFGGVKHGKGGFLINDRKYSFTNQFSAVGKGVPFAAGEEGVFRRVANDPERLFACIEPWPFCENWNLLADKDALEKVYDPAKLCAVEVNEVRCEDPEIISEAVRVLTAEAEKRGTPPALTPDFDYRFFENGYYDSELERSGEQRGVKLYFENLPQVYMSIGVIVQPSICYACVNGGYVAFSGAFAEWLTGN